MKDNQAPVVVATGNESIDSFGGIELDGAAREYTVSVLPGAGRSAGTR